MDIEKRALELIKQQPKEETPVKVEEQQGTPQNIDNQVQNSLKDQYKEKLQEQMNSDVIQQATAQVVERKTKAELTKDMLVVMSDEQQNALAEYYLECQKKQLEYRRKKEKKVIIEETKASIQNRKIEALWLRYGYMYKDKKDFIPNKAYNTQKEIVMFWNGTSENFKKFVKGTIRFLFWGTVVFLIIKYGIKIIKYLPQDFNIQ